MRPLLSSAAIALVLAAPGTLAGQPVLLAAPDPETPGGARVIMAGQAVVGWIESADPVSEDSIHYHLYRYQGEPGEEIVITLRSDDFDAFLVGGRMDGSDFVVEVQDDDSGGGTDARLTVTTGPDGTYSFRARTFAPGWTGAYLLLVRAAGEVEAPSGPPVLRPVALGETVNAEFTWDDPMLPDESYYHLYVYRGRPGERLRVTMRSVLFDAYLTGGRMAGGEFEAEVWDDDGAGGTDALLEITVGETGEYVIRANTLLPGRMGSYTLTIEPADASPVAAPD